MRHFIYTGLFIMVMSSSCNNNLTSGEQFAGNHWLFDSIPYAQQWRVDPDSSLDDMALEMHYNRYPERWNAAFKFLAEQDLSQLEVGRYEIDGDDVYINIDEYETRNYDQTRYESHRKYADIQYLVEGEEQIGVLSRENLSVTVPYDIDRDIEFLENAGEKEQLRTANPSRFLIFFPENAHRPCIRLGNNSKVRKAVVKIKLF